MSEATEAAPADPVRRRRRSPALLFGLMMIGAGAGAASVASGLDGRVQPPGLGWIGDHPPLELVGMVVAALGVLVLVASLVGGRTPKPEFDRTETTR